MAGVTGEIEFNAGTRTHEIRVRVAQEFEVIYGANGFEIKKHGEADVAIWAGEMLIGVKPPAHLCGWLGAFILDRIASEKSWGITTEDMTDAIAEDADYAEEDRRRG